MIRYGECRTVDHTVEENSSIFSLIQMRWLPSARLQGHVSSKTFHQQNPPVLNRRCQLMQADLYNGSKTVVAVIMVSDRKDVRPRYVK